MDVEVPLMPIESQEHAPGRGLRWGFAAWLVLCAIALALELAGVIDELSVPVPLIAALVLARIADGTPHLKRGLVVAVRVGALAAIVVALVLAWRRPALPFVSSSLGAAVVLVSGAALVIALGRASVRRRLLVPFRLDPDSGVHVVVFVAALLMLVGSVVLYVDLASEAGERVGFSPSDSLVSIVGDAALALAGVGFMVTRGPRAALERLGLRRLRVRQLLMALLLAAALLSAVDVLERAENRWLPQIDAREDRFDYEFIGMSPLVGALLLSLAAGVGEELVFRGALQPRLGVVATSVLFAAAHVQYQVPGILMIFVVGLGLGVARERTSTTFTVSVHVLYDLGAMLLP